MTYAPDALKQDRQYLLDTYNAHPGNVSSDLEPDEVGIVGDPAHKGGYHCGSDRLVPDDYSNKTARDRRGLTEAASAIDIGMFSVKGADGKTYDWKDLSVWMVAECRKGAPGTRDIREIIYTDDGKRVLRWDRENGQDSPPHTGEADNSHLTHTHTSKYRDSESRRLTPLFERWNEEILMPTAQEIAKAVWDADQIPAPPPPVNNPDWDSNKKWQADNALSETVIKSRQNAQALAALTERMDQVAAAMDQVLAAIKAGVVVNEQVNLTPEAQTAVAEATVERIKEQWNE